MLSITDWIFNEMVDDLKWFSLSYEKIEWIVKSFVKREGEGVLHTGSCSILKVKFICQFMCIAAVWIFCRKIWSFRWTNS